MQEFEEVLKRIRKATSFFTKNLYGDEKENVECIINETAFFQYTKLKDAGTLQQKGSYTYIYTKVKFAIIDYFRNSDKAGKCVIDWVNKFKDEAKKTGKRWDSIDIGENLGLSCDKTIEILRRRKITRKSLSFEALQGELEITQEPNFDIDFLDYFDVAKLKDDERDVFIKHILQNTTIREISKQTGVSCKVLKVNLKNAVLKLKQLLKKQKYKYEYVDVKRDRSERQCVHCKSFNTGFFKWGVRKIFDFGGVLNVTCPRYKCKKCFRSFNDKEVECYAPPNSSYSWRVIKKIKYLLPLYDANKIQNVFAKKFGVLIEPSLIHKIYWRYD